MSSQPRDRPTHVFGDVATVCSLLLAMIAALLLVTYVPAISLALPQRLGAS